MPPHKERSTVNDSRDSTDSDSDFDGLAPAEKPVSLHPLKFKEAVKGLLHVKPAKKERDE